jgi:peptidoglycan/LPS O-acetylase OafA/YrhL
MEEVRKVSTTTNNNLNSIKFIAALLVIFSHAFPISLGPGKFDPIYYLTNTQISLGNFSVCIFFIIGGYLICSSVNRTPKFKDFFRKRVLRIFPLLLVVLFLTTFVIGPFITSLSIKDYFLNVDTYIYFLEIV